jgi:hypothetical protein
LEVPEKKKITAAMKTLSTIISADFTKYRSFQIRNTYNWVSKATGHYEKICEK